MIYVQYYDYDLSGELSEVCGDRGVVVLDGRNKLHTMKEDAVKFNGYRRPVYKAYQIRSGASFSRYTALTPIIEL